MIACLNVPYFAATVERRDTCAAGPAELGLVIGGQPWEPQPVYAFSHEAAQQGGKPGRSLRLAHVVSPEAHFMAAAPPRSHNVSAEVAGVLMAFTHLIEIEALWSPNIKQATSRPRWGPGVAFGRRLPASYTLDLESLPPAEALALSQEMGRQVRRQTQLTPAVGLAKSKFVAQVAATLARPNHARSITADEEGSFLASQPVHFLPLDKETARRLSLLGLHTLGQLAALPQASIRKLLGPSLAPDSPAGEGFTQFYRLVQERSGRRNLGDDLFLSVKADPPAGQEQIVYRFDGPVIDILVLERVVDQAATELAGRLQRSGSRAALQCQGAAAEAMRLFVCQNSLRTKDLALDVERRLVAGGQDVVDGRALQQQGQTRSGGSGLRLQVCRVGVGCVNVGVACTGDIAVAEQRIAELGAGGRIVGGRIGVRRATGKRKYGQQQQVGPLHWGLPHLDVGRAKTYAAGQEARNDPRGTCGMIENIPVRRVTTMATVSHRCPQSGILRSGDPGAALAGRYQNARAVGLPISCA